MKKRLALIAVAAASFGLAHAQTALPQFENRSGFPLDINDNGVVVGYSATPEGWDAAAVWRDGRVRLLADYPVGRANAVNNAGQAVGYGQTLFTNYFYPLVWNEEIPSELPDLGYGGVANDINNDGVIVGFVFLPGDSGYERKPCKWVNGDLVLLPTSASGGTAGYGSANAINDAGLIGGSVGVQSCAWIDDAFSSLTYASGTTYSAFVNAVAADGRMAGTGYPAVAAFQWTAGATYTILPFVANAIYGEVRGGNAAGLWAGTVSPANEVRIASIWNNGKLDLLPMLPGTTSGVASSINAANKVVGYIDHGMTTQPVIWDYDPLAPDVMLRNYDSAPGMPMQLEAKVQRDGVPVANRSVLFRIGTMDVGSATTDPSGVARISTVTAVGLAAGDHQLMASIGGSRYTLAVLKVHQSASLLAPTSTRGRANETVALQAILRNGPSGLPLSGQRIQLTLPGASRPTTVSTSSTGLGRIGWRIPAGTPSGTHFRVPISYGGNSGHRRAATTLVVTVL
jgi:hypothetical protein